MIGHILGYLPMSPNHMLALITVTLKTEITCVLERWISPYRSTRCHKPGGEHLTVSLGISSCTIRCCVCCSAWRELKAEINKAVDNFFLVGVTEGLQMFCLLGLKSCKKKYCRK